MVVQCPMMEVQNLKKSFQGKTVFENVTFTVAPGEIVGIYGSSGIGKSTLAKVLCGIYAPESGSVCLDGELLAAPGMLYNRKKGLGIQMVYQQPYNSLDGNQKIINGFRELIKYHGFARGKEETDALIREILSQVGLDISIGGHLPRQLSGGEAQRVALARCLLFRPRVLILDEATSMLDVSTQANVLGLTKRVMEKCGGSIILISHDKELVDHYCHKVYIFKKTRLYDEKTICADSVLCDVSGIAGGL